MGIDIKRLDATDRGRKVIYTANHGETEIGSISSWSEERGLIWVRFTSGSTAAACDPEQLDFEFGGYHDA